MCCVSLSQKIGLLLCLALCWCANCRAAESVARSYDAPWSNRDFQRAEKAYFERDFANAELFYNKAMPAAQKLGKNDLHLARILDRLADCCLQQEKYIQAEPLYKRALQDKQLVLPADDPKIVDSLFGLAYLYGAHLHEYDKAEHFYRRALSISENHESNSATTIDIVQHMASFYEGYKKYDQADPLYQRCIAFYQKNTQEHPGSLAIAQRNYARMLHDAHRDAKATAVEAAAKKNPDQPHMPPVRQLPEMQPGWQLYLQHKFAEAEASYERDIANVKNRSTDDFRSILRLAATVYEADGKLDKAEKLLKQHLQIDKQMVGNTRASLANSLLAEIYAKQGRFAEAEPLYHASLQETQHLFGPHSQMTASELQAMAKFYTQWRRYDQAELLYKRALSYYQNSMQLRSENARSLIADYAKLLRMQHRSAEADKLDKIRQ